VKVLVLGPSGMLGHEMTRTLRSTNLQVTTAGRSGSDLFLDVSDTEFSDAALLGFEYIVNCIGLTTHNINVADKESVRAAEILNSEFPKRLVEIAEKDGAKLIQIATDCVFSGAKGEYTETDTHDASDVYGTTKSRGEISSPNAMHLRSSIIGRELRGKKSLLEWVVDQPLNTTIPGFIDRIWNGVTTTAFSKVTAGVILDDQFRSGVWHLLPADSVSKLDLVTSIAQHFGRSDIKVVPSESGAPKNLTLSTNHPEVNQALWMGGGFSHIPRIEELIAAMER
jgi:dTDP-4-dehydrorhamnose reductase